MSTTNIDQRLLDHSKVPGTVISHSPASSQAFIGSPTLIVLANGNYVAAHDFFGPGTEDNEMAVFGSDDVLLQLRKVQAIVSHLGTFPPKRARAAARRAIFYGCMDYRSIKNILRKGLDLQPLQQKPTRAWSHDSRFARSPNDTLFSNQELTHANH